MPDPILPSATVPAPHPAPNLGRLAGNAMANFLRVGTTFLAVLLVPPLLVHSLDRPAYATWMLVLQVSAYATLFDGGLQLAIGRYVAQAEHARSRSYLAEIMSSTAGLLSAIALIVLLIIALLAFFLGRVFPSIPVSLLPQARSSLLLIGGSLGLAFPTSVLAGLYLGLERNKINAIAGAVSKLFGAAGSVWAAQHHQGMAVMALWIAAGNLLQPLLFLAASRGLGLSSLFRLSFIQLTTVSEFARFCSAMTVTQLGMLLISGLDLPIVAAYDFRNAGFYALGATVANIISVPLNTVLSTLVPMISGMSAGDESERMGRVLLRTTRISTTALAFGVVALMFTMPTLLRLWVGPDYMRHTLLFGELLVGAQCVRLFMAPYSQIGFGAGEQRHMLVSPAVESVVNVVFSLILVRKMGAAGVALGTLIGAFAGVALHFLNSMPNTRSLVFSRWQLLSEGILKPVGLCLAWAALLAGSQTFLAGEPARISFLCITALAMAALLWKICLLPEERSAAQVLAIRLLPTGLQTGTRTRKSAV